MRILICEDELIIAMDLKNTLTNLGFEVVSIVKTSEELLKSSEEKQPDLIISDISLPDHKNSVDALKQINSNKKTPVIFVTGLENSSILQKAMKLKPSYYLAKPFNETKLKETIEKCFSA